VQHDKSLRAFFLRIRKRRGTNIAIIATSRKLLTIIYAMLKNNSKYYDLQVERHHRRARYLPRPMLV